MPSFLFCMTLAAHCASLLCVLAYRRGGARHRAGIAWLAWALAAALGSAIIDRVLYDRPAGLSEAVTAVFLAAWMWAAHGNVARLLDASAPAR
jgi:hypothetical protein